MLLGLSYLLALLNFMAVLAVSRKVVLTCSTIAEMLLTVWTYFMVVLGVAVLAAVHT